jgi:hypothetical protein
VLFVVFFLAYPRRSTGALAVAIEGGSVDGTGAWVSRERAA